MDGLGFVLKSLELNSEILYHFVGPQEAIVPEHSEYYHIWAKTTQEIKSIMAEADILFMPFQVTDLIQSVVNPLSCMNIFILIKHRFQ
jgi:hypothetical protein